MSFKRYLSRDEVLIGTKGQKIKRENKPYITSLGRYSSRNNEINERENFILRKRVKSTSRSQRLKRKIKLTSYKRSY